MTKAAHSGASHEKAGDAQRAPAERDLREPEGLADVGQELTHAPHDLIGRRAALLTDPRLRGGVGQRTMLMRQIQRSGGNSYAERLMQRHAAPPIAAPLQREEEGGGDHTPTEAEKKAALQAAAAAEQLAAGSKAKGADQVGQVTSAKAGELAVGQAAKQQGKAALGAAKAAAQQGKAAKKAGALAGKVAMALPAITPKPEAVVPAEPGKAPAAAEQDPGFQSVVTKIKGVSAKQKAHPAAKSKADAAQAAAESPAAELAGQAQGKQAGKMQEAEAPAFDKAAFKAKLMERIAALAPKTTKEADEFKKSDKLSGVKGEMQGSVAEEQQQSVGPTQEATAADPATNPTQPKPVAPLQPEALGALPSGLGANAAAPKPKTAAEIEQPMQASAKSLDQQMAEEDISEQQLKEGNEPEFQGAIDAKSEAKEHATAGPQEFRQAERGQIAQAQGEAAEIATSQTQDMHKARGGALKGIAGKQKLTKSKDEQERAQVGERIQGIYSETKTAVTAKLGGLDAKVTQAFDTGAAAAKKTFEDYVDAKMTAYKEDRYGGWFGWARWAKDKIAGMPSKVNAFYTEGRALYLREMDAVIDRVSTIVVTTLNEARAEVARGRQRIQEYVATLPEKLKGVGAEAAEQTQSQFDELEGQISSKLDETINGLATKYSENLKAVDARIDELKAANQGLVQKAANAIAGVIKTILQLKDMLLGVLARAAGVIGTIIKSPIKFLSNLISGVKQGLSQFVDNIGTHLKSGLMTWLFGELAAGGIELPKSFDIKGILTLVMQVLGLTWQSIRAQAVKILGEPVVKTLEGAFDIFMIIKEQGLGGLWEFIKDKLSDLKDMVIDGIKDMVATEVIKAGVQWLVGLLGGPAGAFIKAAKAIIDIVMWFVNNGSRVMALVNSVLDSVSAIASGSLGQAANFIEQSLAKAVPVMIGFLASLLGLGNLGGKIKAIIERVQAPVKKAIGWVLGKAKGFAAKAGGVAKALGGKVKGALGIKDKPPEQRLKEGLSLGVSAVNKLKGKPMVGEAMLRPILSGIKGLKGLSVLEPVQQDGYWAVHGEVQRATAKTSLPTTPPGSAAPVKETDRVGLWYTDASSKGLRQDGSPRRGKPQFHPATVIKVDDAKKTATIKLDEFSVTPKTFTFDQLVAKENTEWRRGVSGDHTKFIPQRLITTNQADGTKLVVYDGYSGSSFSVVVDQDQVTKQVIGKRLKLKSDVGLQGRRGKLESPDAFAVGMGMDRAHVIADRFLGSGYRDSFNIVPTSPQYNQVEMKKIEDKIAQDIRARKAHEFELQIDLEWGDFAGAKALEAIKARLTDEILKQFKDMDASQIKAALDSYLAQHAALTGQKLKRCMGVTYSATYFSKDNAGRVISEMLPYSIGPDVWIGAS